MEKDFFPDTMPLIEIGTVALVSRILIVLVTSRRKIEVAPLHDSVLRYLRKSDSHYVRITGSTIRNPIDWKSAQNLYASLFSVMDEMRTRDVYYIHLIFVLEIFPVEMQRAIARYTINYIYRKLYGLR